MRKVVDSRLKGRFQGWDHKLVYELENGSSWQLVGLTYLFGYTSRWYPKARIYAARGCHFLQIEGDDSLRPVRRVTPPKKGQPKTPRKPDRLEWMKVLTCQLELAHEAQVRAGRN